MKSILIVTESYSIGGLETHIRGEIIMLSQFGCAVHLAVGSDFSDALLPDQLASLTTGLALHPQATELEFVESVERLRCLIRQHSIECVHAHPFISPIAASIAAELEGIKYSLTLHGPGSLSDVYGPIYDFLLKSIILPEASLVVAVSEEVFQLAKPFVSSSNSAVLPNGVSMDCSSLASPLGEQDSRWLLVSRLDELKAVGIMDFVTKAKSAGIPGVVVAGDGPAKDHLIRFSEDHQLDDFIEFHGFSDNVPRMMQKYAGVAGMGRVVLEGIAAKKPVILVGYDGVKGLLNERLFSKAKHANFSGRNIETLDVQSLARDIDCVANLDIAKLYSELHDEFSDSRIWKTFLRKVKWARRRKSNVLADFYLTLMVQGPSDQCAFLQSATAFGRLGGVLHGEKNFKPHISFAYSYFRDRFVDSSVSQMKAAYEMRVADLDKDIAERDAQIFRLNSDVLALEMEIDVLKNVSGSP